jgi:hypothetical protein
MKAVVCVCVVACMPNRPTKRKGDRRQASETASFSLFSSVPNKQTQRKRARLCDLCVVSKFSPQILYQMRIPACSAAAVLVTGVSHLLEGYHGMSTLNGDCKHRVFASELIDCEPAFRHRPTRKPPSDSCVGKSCNFP